MGRTIQPAASGVDAIVFINDKMLAGQKNIFINRQTSIVNVTNEIQKNWSVNLPSTKSWTVNCGGMVIKDEAAFQELEDAYSNGRPLTIEFRGSGKTYHGTVYITQFPLLANYSDTFTYNLTFIGSGELTLEN